MRQRVRKSRQLGRFTLPSGRELPGELTLAGLKTALRVHSNERFALNQPRQFITGILQDLTRVSLINCVAPPEPASTMRGEETGYYANVVPHFVIVGDRHLRPDEPTVTSVDFQVGDASILFRDFDAFGWVSDPGRFIEEIVKASVPGRRVAIGPDPQIAYFTGKREIFSTPTAIGEVSAWHSLPPIPHVTGGRSFADTVPIGIDFEETVDFNEAILRTLRVIEYLGLIVGRPQDLLTLHIGIASDRDHPVSLRIHWSFPPRRDASTEWEVRPDSFDLLLDPCRTSDEFACVLERWFSRQETWHGARWRFFNSFGRQRQYDIERLVGSANMFDILPDSAIPASVEISEELKDAQSASRTRFRALPPSPERDSVLAALGRIGKCALKHKVRYRAEKVISCAGQWFEDLCLVTNEAVNCRNYYVHGGDARFDYDRNFQAVIFFTDTLEFVFAASDLIEAGWDIRSWIEHGTTMTHPFGRYRASYPIALPQLRTLLQ